MRIKKYTVDHIKAAWERYKTDHVFAYLRDGQKIISREKPTGLVNNLKLAPAQDAMGFPQYLSDFYEVA